MRKIKVLDSEIEVLDMLWMIAQGCIVLVGAWAFFCCMALLGTAVQG